MDRATYERCGLQGTPYGPKGKRNLKPWWIIEINLRLPSMLHGKKGFERIVRAFENVLFEEVEWLFCDLGKTGTFSIFDCYGLTTNFCTEISPSPLAKHHPVEITVSPVISKTAEIKIPEFKVEEDSDPSTIDYPDEFSDYVTELYEWLSLVSLSSPRVEANDQIDPYLSRYVPPPPSSTPEQCELVKITWSGFLPSKWIHETFVKILLANRSVSGGKTWFSYGICGFHKSWSSDSRDALVLKLPGPPPGEYILWDVSQRQQ